MARVHQSSRLLYRAIESDDAAFLHSVQADVEAFAGSDVGLLVPETKANSASWQDGLMNQRLLAVIICLPASATVASTASTASTNPTTPAVSTGQTSEAVPPTPIGVISLTKPQGSHHRHTFIAIDIIAGYRGKGYGGEAIRWAVAWAFRHAGMHRVGIEAFGSNEGANRLYEKLGFTLEGRKRQLYWRDGGWDDLISYSILEDEWPALRARWEAQTA